MSQSEDKAKNEDKAKSEDNLQFVTVFQTLTNNKAKREDNLRIVTVINHLANGQTIKRKIRTNFVYLGDFMDQVYEEFRKSPFQLKPLYLISSQGNKLYLQPHHTLKQIFDNYDCPINVEFSPDVEDWDEDRTSNWLSVVGLPTESLKLTGKDLIEIQKVEDLDEYESLSEPDKKLLLKCIDRLKGSWGWSGY